MIGHDEDHQLRVLQGGGSSFHNDKGRKVLVSSNPQKLREGHRYSDGFLQPALGDDLPEVKPPMTQQGAELIVGAYKGRDARDAYIARGGDPNNTVVSEDSILIIEIQNSDRTVTRLPLVDVRWEKWVAWALRRVKVCTVVMGIVMTEVNSSGELRQYMGEVRCRLRASAADYWEKSQTDDILIPLDNNPDGLTITELKKRGLGDEISFRRIAVEKMLRGEVDYSINVSELPEWRGEMQKAEEHGQEGKRKFPENFDDKILMDFILRMEEMNADDATMRREWDQLMEQALTEVGPEDATTEEFTAADFPEQRPSIAATGGLR